MIYERTNNSFRSGSRFGEGNGARVELHLITIRLGIAGSDPEQLTQDCIAYVKAVDAAVAEAQLPEGMLRAYVMEHDYGALFRNQGGGLAYWPELHCAVAVEELWT